MAVAAAERQEVYAQSLRNFDVMGRLACQGLVESPEYIGARTERRADFFTGIAENLATDPDYHEQLYFAPMEKRPYYDGHVRDKAGKPISEVIDNGIESSRAAAEDNSEMLIEAERAEGDREVIKVVDSLQVGESYIVPSIEPKDELKRNLKFWQDKMHYREGMAVVQQYYRASEHEVWTWYYAVKRSNLAAFRVIFGARGITIPEDESPNRYIRHGIRQKLSPEEAMALGPKLVREHRKLIGDIVPMISATEIVHENSELVDKFFQAYLEPLSIAFWTQENQPVLQNFALTLLQNGEGLSQKLKEKLWSIGTSREFNDEDARLIEEKVRYAVVEELRKQIPIKLRAPHTHEVAYIEQMHSPVYQQYTAYEIAALHEQAAGNIIGGILAGRRYGGCAGSGEDNQVNPLDDVPGRQKPFGGLADTAESNENNGEDKNSWVWKKGVCRVDKCPTRPSETEIGPCEVCRNCQNWFDKGRDPFKIYEGLTTAIRTTVEKSDTHKQSLIKPGGLTPKPKEKKSHKQTVLKGEQK